MNKIYLILVLFLPLVLRAQMKVGDNPNTINPSAVLEAESVTKGFLMPRLTTTQMNAISNPALGLMIYNTTDNCIFVYRGNALGWKSTCTELPVWGLYGNTGNDANAFVGTTDNQPIIFKSNNIQRGVLTANGNFGIGMANPNYALVVSAPKNPLQLIGLESGADADSILTIDPTGVVKKRSLKTAIFKNLIVNSGLTANNGNIQMGGPIQQNTNIQFNNYNITYTGIGRFGIGTENPEYLLDVSAEKNPIRLKGLALGSPSDYVVTDSAGVLRHRPASDFIAAAITANNGISFTSNNIQLGGNLSKNTNIGLGSNNLTFDGNGLFGIGTATPNNKLDVVATADPIRLTGVLGGTSADSVLTINNLGVVKKRSVASLLLSGGTPFINGGNALNGPGLLGSSNNQPISIITNGKPVITFGTDGSITQNGTAPVTFGGPVTNNGTVTNNNGSDTKGLTNINTTGSGTTNIGNPNSTTNIDGTNFNVPNLPSGAPTDSVVVVDPTTGKLKKISLAMVGANSFTVANGLNKTGNHVELGGLLNKNTNISFNNNNITFDGNGYFGIGTPAPAHKLEVNATADPLRLGGLLGGSNADSILTINNLGIVKKRTVSSLLLSAGTFVNGGNTLSGPGLLGSLNNQPISIITNGTPVVTFGTNGSITQNGTAPVTFAGTVNANGGITATGTNNLNTTGSGTNNIGNPNSTTNIDQVKRIIYDIWLTKSEFSLLIKF